MPRQKNYRSTRSSKRSNKTLLTILVAVLLLAAATVVVLNLTSTIHFFGGHPTTIYHPSASTASQNTKGEPTTPATNTKEPVTSTTNPSGGSTNVTLVAPSGSFVNNHHPDLTSSPATNQMFSVCNTSPGATCQITFTNTSSGISKTLAAQVTNGSGVAYWSWTLQQVGLTQGTWQTKAIASLDGQSQSADDAMNLEVGP